MEPESNGHIDVLLLTQHDWANSAMRYAKCLEMLGLKVMAFKGEKHPFEYSEELPIHPSLADRYFSTYHFIPKLKPYAEKAKVLHFCTSTFIDTGVDPFNKKIVMQHGGTAYRQGHENLNQFYNHFVDETIIQCPDLLDLGANDEHLVYYPVELDKIEYDEAYAPANEGKIIFGHFPRDPVTKGTENILSVLLSLKEMPEYKDKFDYMVSLDAVPWRENLERMAKCDVIIECCNAVQGDKKFGEWGNTALEAAAMGKVVITNSLSLHTYNNEYGVADLLIANNKEELERRVVNVLKWQPELLAHCKRKSRQWAKEKHSMEATAKRLWNKVYQPLFEGGKEDG